MCHLIEQNCHMIPPVTAERTLTDYQSSLLVLYAGRVTMSKVIRAPEFIFFYTKLI